MIRTMLIPVTAAAVLILAGCGESERPATPTDAEIPASEAGASESAEAGGEVAAAPAPSPEEAYQLACAMCHDLGVNGAPRTDDPDAWSGRSPLWDSVMFEHEAKGYFSIPAASAGGELSEETIAAGAAHMRAQANPDETAD